MKATELLRLYKAGQRDFRGEKLRGQNFKGQNLAGADFSGADIRSTNFTNANLTNANFSRANAGLQCRWAISLILLTFLLSGLSGLFAGVAGAWVAPIFDASSVENQITGWVALATIVTFLILLVRKGVRAVAVAVAVAVAGIGAGIGALALVAAVARSVAGIGAIAVVGAAVRLTSVVGAAAGTLVLILALALAVAGAVAGAVSVLGAAAGTLALILALAVAVAVAVVGATAGTVAIALTLVSTYIGWRALQGDERYSWIRSMAIAFAAFKGTSFRGATLTDADFSQARLKSTDLRRAVLLRTRWRDAEKLDRVRPGESYLSYASVRQLVLTGEGQGQSYANLLNLTGINVQGADLVQADFTGSNLKDSNLQGATLANARLISTNLNGANLQDTDLSNAKLVQAQLDEADLTGAVLTGACIEDWGITTRTKLNGIRCDYVFMRLLSDRRPDQNPHRKPDDWAKTFAEGEFVDFITPMVETLDLYHNQAVDPRAVAIAFNELRDQNPDAGLEIVSMEKRGWNRDKFLLRAETTPAANLSELHSQYFDLYDHLLTLPPEAIQALLIEKDKHAKQLAGLIGTAIAQPKTQIDTYNSQGDTTMSQSDSGAPKYDMRGSQFAGGFAETVEGDQIGGPQHNYAAPEKQDLAAAALEIQRLLKQLEETNPTATEAEQKAFVTAAIPPTLRQRAVGALQSGGKAAVEELLENPYINIAIAVIEGWQSAKEISRKEFTH